MDEQTLLAVKFLLTIIPEEYIQVMTKNLYQVPYVELLNGTQMFLAKCKWQPTGEYTHDKTLTMNGLMLGFSLGILIQKSETVALDIKRFLEHESRLKGENIYDFSEHRAKRLAARQNSGDGRGPPPTG